MFLFGAFPEVLRLTPLEVITLTFLVDRLTTIGCDGFPITIWHILMALTVLLLASAGWHVPQSLPCHTLGCRALTCMCCYQLAPSCPFMATLSFLDPTFGKQGRVLCDQAEDVMADSQFPIPQGMPHSIHPQRQSDAGNIDAVTPGALPTAGFSGPASVLTSNLIQPACDLCRPFEENVPDSIGCENLQRQVGCHACQALGCWRTKPSCPFYGRDREGHRDASFGDNVPHMHQTRIEILKDGVALQPGRRLSQSWWIGHNIVLRIEGLHYCMGAASGDGFNCLIDTLRQSLGLVCNVSYVRRILEQWYL